MNPPEIRQRISPRDWPQKRQHNQISRLRLLSVQGWQTLLVVPLAIPLAASLLLGCAAEQRTDCQQLLDDAAYQKVVDTCENPYQLAMGYLGLAGFDFLDYLAAENPNNIVALLDLNASNVSAKRKLINNAVRAVGSPDRSQQAFLLLLSAYLGLAVTTAEYLDTGGGGHTAFDNKIAFGELQAATGLVIRNQAMLGNLLRSNVALSDLIGGSYQFHMTAAGVPYTVDCRPNPLNPPVCGGMTTIRADRNPVPGAGLDTRTPSLVRLADAVDANRMVMLVGLEFPIVINADKTTRLNSFLGKGTLDPNFPSQNPNLFPIGVVGYLELLALASAVLTQNAGEEEDDPDNLSKSTLVDSINKIRTLIDNGASCFSDESSALRTDAGTQLNLLYAMYQVAPGTNETPVPDPEDYTAFNVVSSAAIAASGLLPMAIRDPPAFGLEIGIKVLYPRVLYAVGNPLRRFNRANATPRIDQTPQEFQDKFNLLPQLAPDAARPLDGEITMVELLCVRNAI